MTNEWVCPHCGHENENTERIALKELCRRCCNERITAKRLEQQIIEELEILDGEKVDIIEKLDNIDDVIGTMNIDQFPIQEKKRDELVKQYHDIEMKEISLKGKTIYSEKIRRIYKDQKFITDFK